jgi:hypothetical protein
METLSMPVNLDIQGSLRVRGDLPEVPRSSLSQENFAPVSLPLENFRIWDAYGTLVGTPASDDLGMAAGAFGTGCPYLSAGDLKAAGATTRRARTVVRIPLEYVDGESVRIVLEAGMVTTVADTACTVDVEVFVVGGNTLVSGSDVVSTAAQSMNSLTFAEKAFDLTSTTLDAGTLLDVRVSVTCTDAATVTAVIPAIASARLSVDIKG